MTLIEEKMSLDDALVHFGVKGMKWGVRKVPEQGEKRVRTPEEKKALAKKAAIGAGVLVGVAGAAFVTYKLGQSGKLPISSLAKAKKPTPAVKKIIQEPTDVIHFSRGKNRGLHFLNQGGTPNFFDLWDEGLGKHAHSSQSEIFENVGGRIAARFTDPEGRHDFAGRLIQHEIIVPKSMTPGINSIDDVRTKIWPHLKDTYDAMYKESLAKPY